MKVTKIPFHGEEVSVIHVDGNRFVPVRPIIERIGLSWSRQAKKLTSNPRWCSVALRATVAKNEKERVLLCLTPRKLRGFLYTIDARKVNPEYQPVLEMYQEEIDEVLEQYSENGVAINPRMATALPNPEPIKPLQEMVSIPSAKLFDLYESKLKLMAIEYGRERAIFENPKPEIYVNLQLADQILEKFLAYQDTNWIAKQLGTNNNTVRHTVVYMVKKALGKSRPEVK